MYLIIFSILYMLVSIAYFVLGIKEPKTIGRFNAWFILSALWLIVSLSHLFLFFYIKH